MKGTPGEQPPAGTWRAFFVRRAPLLLVISLAINLLVLGAVGGAAFMHRRFGPPDAVFGASLSPGEVFAFVRTLPGDRRREMRRIVMADRSKLQELRGAVQRERLELGRVIAGEPLDRGAFAVQAQRLWTAEGELRRTQLQVLENMVAGMNRDERSKFASWRTSFPRPHGGPHARPGEDGGEGPPEPPPGRP